MHIVNTLAPVFLLIALGAALRRTGFVSPDLLRGINRLAYWVGLPALLFSKIAVSPAVSPAAVNVFLVVLIGTGVCVAVCYLAAALLRMRGEQTGPFVQAGFRGNLAYVGLAVVLYAFSESGGDARGAEAQTMAILALAPTVVIYNIAAVVVLLIGRHRMGAGAARKIAVGIVTNPLLIASAAGIAWSLAGWRLPLLAARTLSVTGQFALPAALLGIGGMLASAKIGGRVLYSTAAALIKTAVAPTVGYAAALALGLGREQAAVAIILLATPTAVASYILTDQLGGDATLAAGAIVLSTFMSIVSLSVAVGMI